MCTAHDSNNFMSDASEEPEGPTRPDSQTLWARAVTSRIDTAVNTGNRAAPDRYSVSDSAHSSAVNEEPIA